MIASTLRKAVHAFSEEFICCECECEPVPVDVDLGPCPTSSLQEVLGQAQARCHWCRTHYHAADPIFKQAVEQAWERYNGKTGRQ